MARRVQRLLGAPARRARKHPDRDTAENEARRAVRRPAMSDRPVVVVRRTIAAPRERVFDTWLDPALLARFMLPGDVSHATAEVDARVGGRFRIVMNHGRGGAEHWGEYLVIDPPKRLSFTWISASTDLQT